MNLLAWPLKRLIFDRLSSVASGALPPPAGAELVVSTPARPVEVAQFEPPEPGRICVYGMPVRSSFTESTAELPAVSSEQPTVEVRLRMFEIGEDLADADYRLGVMCQAVANAVLSGTPLLSPQGRVYLAAMAQNVPLLRGQPEPDITLLASLVFRGEVHAYG